MYFHSYIQGFVQTAPVIETNKCATGFPLKGILSRKKKFKYLNKIPPPGNKK